MKDFRRILGRELKLAFRERAESLLVVLFFVLGAVLFPFGVGPEPNMLARIAAGIVWVMALFAAMLSLERMFQSDFFDSSRPNMRLCMTFLPSCSRSPTPPMYSPLTGIAWTATENLRHLCQPGRVMKQEKS